MNVSLTRAKYALYVVAHFDSLEVCICFFIGPNKKKCVSGNGSENFNVG